MSAKKRLQANEAISQLEELIDSVAPALDVAAHPAKIKPQNLTPEQKANRLERHRERYASMTPEQKAKRLERQREQYPSRTPEQKEKRLESNRKWRASLTPEQVAAIKLKQKGSNDRRREWYKNMEPEKKSMLLNKYSAAIENSTGDPTIFAINQSVKYASNGSVARDITLNCPEPARSKLQVLVDKIKADPTAGKPVIAMLINMRELRKLELAEQQLLAEQQGEQPTNVDPTKGD
jgi:hypothetical protein